MSPTQGRVPEKHTIRMGAQYTPKLRNRRISPQKMHKACTNRAEIREKVGQILRLQFATSNLSSRPRAEPKGRDLQLAAKCRSLTPFGMTKSAEFGALEWRTKSAASLRGLLSRCGYWQNLFHINLGGIIPRIAGRAISGLLSVRASFLKTFQREIS